MKKSQVISYCTIFACLFLACKDNAPQKQVENFDINEIYYKKILRTVDSIDIHPISPIHEKFSSKTYQREHLLGHVKSIYEHKYSVKEMHDQFNKKKDGKAFELVYSEFNEKGDKLIKTKYDKQNNPILTESYTYDGAGNCIQEVITNNINNLIEYYTNFTYQNGICTNESVIYPTTENSFTCKISYDSLNFPIEKNSYNHQNELFLREVFKYDSLNHNLTHVYEYNKKGFLSNHHLYRYNLLNYMRTHRTFNSRKDIENALYYKYEYDSQYNWITKVEYRYGNPENIWKRKITYFQ